MSLEKMLFSFEGSKETSKKDPVAIAKWTHLNSSRTQKLSTFTATIVGLAPAKIASCRVFFFTLFLELVNNILVLLRNC